MDMADSAPSPLRLLPAVATLLASPQAAPLLEAHGRIATTGAIRVALEDARRALQSGAAAVPDIDTLLVSARAQLEGRPASLRPVFNLTGTVLHTNLGRALLAEAAIAAATEAMRHPVALEYDLDEGGRGERDDHVRELLRELTGAEDATLVNNNAAAVLLCLNTFALGRGAIVSRGELIEIGGAFRMPDIMARAGANMVEVGTTNRTHAADYRNAVNSDTGLILKVHTSNYRIEGFTAEVSARDLAHMADTAGIPLLNDLGSGSLVDLSAYGITREATVREAVAEGAHLVTFSGDKLLGGPQAGFIVGSHASIAAINRNPLKRALRVDKVRLAAIEATLRLYRDPDRLAERLPTLRSLARSRDDMAAQAARLRDRVAAHLGAAFRVEVGLCDSQVGSGALPLDTLPSAALQIHPTGSQRTLDELATAWRGLPRPVIGRVTEGALQLDLRCLDEAEEPLFLSNLTGRA
jgi:L-seryl-tRNA(Ser) seleniumtransferase